MLNSDQFFEGLVSCVLSQGRMSIPGFGVFVKERLEAQPDPVAGIIRPPGNLLVLKANQENEADSVPILASHLNVDQTEVAQFIATLIEDWNSKLDQKEIIEIAGFGRIFKEFTGELNFGTRAFNSL